MAVNPLFLTRCLDFSLAVSRLLSAIPKELLGPKMRDQIVASSTSIGANVAEAQSAQSRSDFINKLEIALKEARETAFRLAYIRGLTSQSTELQARLAQECNELTAILVSSVKTAKGRMHGEWQ